MYHHLLENAAQCLPPVPVYRTEGAFQTREPDEMIIITNMCGIFGYYSYNGTKDVRGVLDVLFQGLRRLEYRGYDSAGICVDFGSHVNPRRYADDTCAGSDQSKANRTFKNVHRRDLSKAVVLKSQGKIDVLQQVTDDYISDRGIDVSRQQPSHIAISHTRWATHGAPSAVNAHPHTSDADNEFVVVHNGIITNYAELRDWLIKQGDTFVSETDTEVIPKLCRYVFNSLVREGSITQVDALHSKNGDGDHTRIVPFPRLVMEVFKRLEGAYAILVRSSHYPGEMIACKRGSPLICGIGVGTDSHDLNRHLKAPDCLGASAVTASDTTVARIGSFTRLSDSVDRATWAPSLECWIASDASAVVEHTKKVVVLEDGDVLHVCGGGWGIYNMQETNFELAVPRALQTLQVEIEHIMKGGYDHYMQKEIHEQPDSILQTMRGRVPVAGSGHPPALERDSDLCSSSVCEVKLGGLMGSMDVIRRSRRIVFVACGTSYHACLAARSTIEQLAELAVVLELASDLLDRQCPIFRDDTCVFVSQSGETADTLQALNYAKSRGALCVGITNTVGSAISRATDCGIHQNAGYEIGVASTKAYTSQIVCVTMMALALSNDSIARRKRHDEVIRELSFLPSKIRSALQLDDSMRALAKKVNDLAEQSNSLLFFGRGANYATALEAALKMKEVALIHSEGILAGEMKHGPLALVDETLPIVVIATGDSMYAKMQSVIQQLLARGAQLVVICDEGDESMRALARDRPVSLIEVPKTCDALQPVINIIPMQLLAYHLTVLRGFNVDQPRNLAKSVTVAD